MLDDIVWASLKNRVKKITALSKAKFVVVDAPMLLDAGWDSDGVAHQIWSCIVPPIIAIRRIVERDNVTSEEVILYAQLFPSIFKKSIQFTIFWEKTFDFELRKAPFISNGRRRKKKLVGRIL